MSRRHFVSELTLSEKRKLDSGRNMCIAIDFKIGGLTSKPNLSNDEKSRYQFLISWYHFLPQFRFFRFVTVYLYFIISIALLASILMYFKV